ncbi:MAG: tetratricopeptide repeat protein [Desulfovibrio sp.]|jgi:predicted negative regulator of RcsB-dependent stress response|nr:tetratricopeptide repeat protein [Desulfovibrio sp.]
MSYSALKLAFLLLGFPLALAMMFFLGGYYAPKEIGWKSDLAMAEKALKDRDIGDAEMFYERYLRKNPTGEQRWKVWDSLLNISLNFRQDKLTAKHYLEIMLLEYADDVPKRRKIRKQLAGVCNDLRLYDRAVAIWEALVKDEETPAEEKAVFYRDLFHAYMRRLEFTMATDVLNLCLQSEITPATKADCLYDLAEAEMFAYDLEKSEKALRSLLEMPAASSQRRVLAVFMLADVLEQQNRFEEADQLFTSIRENFPNSKVIEMRISSLKGRQRQATKKSELSPVRRR